MSSFTDDIRARGMTPGSRTFELRLVKAGAKLGRMLHVSPSEPVVVAKRLRLADRETMAIETLHVRESLIPGLTKHGHANLKNVRAQLVTFLSGFQAATGRLQASMKAVGPPAVKNGGKIQTIIRGGIAKAQIAVAAAKKQAAALPTNNAALLSVRRTRSRSRSRPPSTSSPVPSRYSRNTVRRR